MPTADPKTTKGFKPQNLKSLLIFILLLVVLGMGGAFYLSVQALKTYATQVNQRSQDAEASSKQLDQLQRLRTQLSQSKDLIATADNLFATTDTYQSQALTDIRNHANHAGLTVASTEFSADESNPNIRTVTIKLASPVAYSKLVAFFDGLESNTPKLQVSSVTLKHVEAGTSDSVEVGDITITISVR